MALKEPNLSKTIPSRMCHLPFVLIFIAMGMLTGCVGGISTSYQVEYPKGVSDRQKLGRVLLEVHGPFGDYTARRRRKIVVTVEDRISGNRAIWEATVVSASPRIVMTHEDKEGIEFDIAEFGNQFAIDPYNAELLRSGPKRIVSLRADCFSRDGKMRIRLTRH